MNLITKPQSRSSREDTSDRNLILGFILFILIMGLIVIAVGFVIQSVMYFPIAGMIVLTLSILIILILMRRSHIEYRR